MMGSSSPGVGRLVLGDMSASSFIRCPPHTQTCLNVRSNPGREFVLRMSALEIYNEEVKDLLRGGGGGGERTHHPRHSSVAGPLASSQPSGSSTARRGLKVQDDPGSVRGVHVEGLVEEGLRSVEHLEKLLEAVEAARHVRDPGVVGVPL